MIVIVVIMPRDGLPAARMVLCKGVDDLGFRFFTNYESHKASDLAANPRAALVFWWGSLQRSVSAAARD